MKPIAKKGLIAVGVLYTITVALMITDFVRAGKPVDPTPTIRHIQSSLEAVREEAAARDPEHIRTTEITDQEARSVMDNLLVRKGTIINVNYTLVMQGLNFGILLLVLYGILWDPLMGFLDRRREIIRKNLDEAAEESHQARQMREERQEELRKLREQRGEILEQARIAAEDERRKIVEHAHEEAQRTLQQTRDRLSEEGRRASAALREELADYSTAIAARLLRREVSKSDHEEFIERMVKELNETEVKEQ